MSDQAVIDDSLNENFIDNQINENIENDPLYQAMDENDIINQQEEEVVDANMSLFDKLSPKDLLDVINDTFPSLIYILILIIPFYYNPKYCDLNIYLSMKTLAYCYLFFIIRALIKLGVIHFNKKDIVGYKIFLLIIDLLTAGSYYICIYISYIIYSQSDAKCFRFDTLTVFSFFSILFIGVISFFQTVLNYIMLSIYFILMIETFISDPIFFYNRYAMDPDIIHNLPTIKADNKHVGSCIICLKDIKKDDPIIILNCPGNHFFHGECIKKWLLVKTTCPICRSQLAV